MRTKHLNNEKGIATLESALLLSIFVVFMTYCVGTFGVIHTGILSSISARAYAFETFRNRTNLIYFRDTATTPKRDQTFNYGVRLHGIVSEKEPTGDQWDSTPRSLAQGREVASSTERSKLTPEMMNKLDNKRETTGVNPVHIKVLYGICLNYDCGDDK